MGGNAMGMEVRKWDPSVGSADSSPCRGALRGGGSVYGILRCAQDDSKFQGETMAAYRDGGLCSVLFFKNCGRKLWNRQ